MALTKEQKVMKQFVTILAHPKYFIKYAVKTQDQQDPENSCKPLPLEEKEYISHLIDLWYENNKICVLKSRQVIVSWTLLACNAWLALSGSNRDIYIKRTKWDDAIKLLERMMFIFDNIPDKFKQFMPKYKDDKLYTYKEGQITIPHLNTKIYAMASGQDQGRGETPTSILFDEFAFDEDDIFSYNTMKPAIQGAARVALISTPVKLFGDRDPFHRKIFEDRLGEGYEDLAPAKNEEFKKYNDHPSRFHVKYNPGNGFVAIKLHYTADPAKRDALWKKRARSGMDKVLWDVEMELSWETFAGAGVFSSEYNPEIHVLKHRREPDPNHPVLFRGWDFGGNHSVVVCQRVRQKLYVIDEFPNMGYNTREIAAHIQQECMQRYGDEFSYVEVIDPSGRWEGKTSTGLACKDVMNDLDMNIIAGVQDPTRRIDAVMKLLSTNSGGTPNLLFNPGLHMCNGGMIGGYHYPEKETQNQKINRPVKNQFSHIMDALEYVATKFDTNVSPMGRYIPKSGGGLNVKL